MTQGTTYPGPPDETPPTPEPSPPPPPPTPEPSPPPMPPTYPELAAEYTRLCAEMGQAMIRAWLELSPRFERVMVLESQAQLLSPPSPTPPSASSGEPPQEMPLPGAVM